MLLDCLKVCCIGIVVRLHVLILRRAMVPDDGARQLLEVLFIEQTPSASLIERLLEAVDLVATHPSLRNSETKTRLLLPLTDLLDIPVVVRAQTDVSFADRDVISKIPLRGGIGTANSTLGIRQCVRCGNRSELRWLNRYSPVGGDIRVSTQWNAVVNEWQRNCVCGGGWALSHAR